MSVGFVTVCQQVSGHIYFWFPCCCILFKSVVFSTCKEQLCITLLCSVPHKLNETLVNLFYNTSTQSLQAGDAESSKYKPFLNRVYYLTCAPFQRLILPAHRGHGIINLSDNLVFNRRKNISQIAIQGYFSFPLPRKHEMNLKHDQQERAKSILHA